MAQFINLSKSIRYNRLYYKKTTAAVFDQVLNYSAIMLLFLAATLPLLIKPAGMYHLSRTHTVLIISFVTYLCCTLYLMNKLVKAKGLNLYHNRKDIETVLGRYFEHLVPEDCGEGVLRYVKLSGFVTWGRIITVLFDKDNVYLNITTLGRADSASIFHGLTNYIKCRQIMRKFKRTQNLQVV
jgi:hypothetical protein